MQEEVKNHENEEIGVPKKRPVFLLVLLGIITLGIHQFFWLIRRSPELNNLETKTKSTKKLLIISAITHILSLLVLVSTIIYFKLTSQQIAYDISQVPLMFIIAFSVFIFLELFSCIIYLTSSFKVRKILNETLMNKHSDPKIKVSGFYTLIFQIYYLQYEINRIIKDKETEKKKAPLIVLILAIIIIIISVFIIPTLNLLNSPIN